MRIDTHYEEGMGEQGNKIMLELEGHELGHDYTQLEYTL